MAVDVVKVRGRLGMAVRWGRTELADQVRVELAAGLIENEIERQLDSKQLTLTPALALRLCNVIAARTDGMPVPAGAGELTA